MSKIIDLNWLDRQRIREQIRIDMLSRYNFTPVLLMYWTSQNLSQFLIPATIDELNKLKLLNGIDEGCGIESDKQKAIFHWLKNKISYKYVDDDGEHPQGEWREMYFIDTMDEDEKRLPPVTLPPGTVIIITGMVL